MVRVRICREPEECAELWQRYWPCRSFFDLWQVRAVFARNFQREPHFLVAEEDGAVVGLMALCRIEETGTYAHFPGEIWQGKTWLEQNKILAGSPLILRAMLDHIPGETHLRYLTSESVPLQYTPVAVDEVGYIFTPPAHDFSFTRYMESFSGKSRKKLSRELAHLYEAGVTFRHDCPDDLELMFRMNLHAFGDYSYFRDQRFLRSFEELAGWLEQNRMLSVTTMLVGGRVVAIDLGAVWQRTHTVLAGGTDPEFPGVAKVINFHHLERACQEKMEEVDFLCGDFGWKQRFHLTPRPLYEMHLQAGIHTQTASDILTRKIRGR